MYLFSYFLIEKYYFSYLEGTGRQINLFLLELDAIYDKSLNLSPKNNVILLGSSSTISGVIPDRVILPPGWKLTNLAISKSNLDCFEIILNHINDNGKYNLSKNDLVIVHINFSTFTELDEQLMNIKDRFGFFGLYSIDKNHKVQSNSNKLFAKWKLINYKLNIFDHFLKKMISYFSVVRIDIKDIRAIFLGEKTEEEKQARTERIKRESYQKFLYNKKKNNLSPRLKNEFRSLIMDLNAKTNIVVINMYNPLYISDFTIQKEFKVFWDSDARPFLQSQGIPVIDVSDSIPESEFSDSVHLTLKGRKIYTEIFNREIEKVFKKFNLK
jgi:hypothetical protein